MNSKVFYHPRALIVKVFIIVFLFCTLFLFYLKEINSKAYTEIVFLDVGQGDGAIIEVYGSNATTTTSNSVERLMIDTGRGQKTISSIEKFYNRDLYNYLYNHNIYTLGAGGAEGIDTLLLTHNDDDHIAMRCEIVEKYHVKRIIISNSISTSTLLACDHNNYLKDNIASASTSSDHIEVISVHAGDSFDIYGNRFDILHPSINYKPKSNSDNEESIVVLATIDTNANLTPISSPKERGVNSNKVKILLTGDIDKKVERNILNQDLNPKSNPLSPLERGQPLVQAPRGALKGIDILKVAHHGSDGSSDPIFIQYTHPVTSIISVGKNNYGHPSPRVLRDLISASSTIHRTDQEGNVMFRFE